MPTVRNCKIILRICLAIRTPLSRVRFVTYNSTKAGRTAFIGRLCNQVRVKSGILHLQVNIEVPSFTFDDISLC